MQGRMLKPKPPPRPVASVTKVERRGRVVLRLGRVATHRMNRRAWPLRTLLLGVGGGYFGTGTVYLVRGSPAPLAAVMFTCVGSVLIGTAAWLLCVAARDGARRHVVYLSGRRFGLGSTAARGRDRRHRCPRRRFIRRDRIEGIGSGRAGGSVMLALRQLHVYLKDGSRVGLLDGRPGDELEWVAHLLSCATEEVAPEPPPASSDVGAAAPVASSVVPYETPDDDPYFARIRRSQDGTLMVTLPPTADEQVQRITKHLFLLAILGVIGTAVLEWLVLRGPGLLNVGGGAVVALAVGVVVRSLVRYLARHREPNVITVDSEHVYFNGPGKPQRWPRWKVVDVRDGRPNRGSIKCELVLAGGTSVPIAVGRDEWERRRIIAALREALGMYR